MTTTTAVENARNKMQELWLVAREGSADLEEANRLYQNYSEAADAYVEAYEDLHCRRSDDGHNWVLIYSSRDGWQEDCLNCGKVRAA